MLTTTTFTNPRRLAVLAIGPLAAVLAFAFPASRADALVETRPSGDGAAMLIDVTNGEDRLRYSTVSVNGQLRNRFSVSRFDGIRNGTSLCRPAADQPRQDRVNIVDCLRTPSRPLISLGGGPDVAAPEGNFLGGIRINGGLDRDVIGGAAGNDALITGQGNFERVRGRAGRDILRTGPGFLESIFARDGEPDAVIDCGSGFGEFADIDLTDPTPVGCSSVVRGAVGEGPNVRVRTNRSRLRSRRRVRMRMRCPASLREDCEGRASVRLVNRRCRSADPRRTSYDINPGESEVVTVRVGRRERRCILRRNRIAQVTAREQGDLGPKTTTKRIAVTPPR